MERKLIDLSDSKGERKNREQQKRRARRELQQNDRKREAEKVQNKTKRQAWQSKIQKINPSKHEAQEQDKRERYTDDWKKRKRQAREANKKQQIRWSEGKEMTVSGANRRSQYIQEECEFVFCIIPFLVSLPSAKT